MLDKVLTEFGETSGLRMNEGKSALYCGGLSPQGKVRLLDICHMKEGELPVRYLGVQMHHRSLNIAEYRHLVERIHKAISNWATRQLSFAGRLALVNSVLYSMIRF